MPLWARLTTRGALRDPPFRRPGRLPIVRAWTSLRAAVTGGTDAVTKVNVPPPCQKYTFTFEMDRKNQIVGKPEFSFK